MNYEIYWSTKFTIIQRNQDKKIVNLCISLEMSIKNINNESKSLLIEAKRNGNIFLIIQETSSKIYKEFLGNPFVLKNLQNLKSK